MMKKKEDLRNSAKNNSEKDFAFAYYDHIDEALLDGMAENKDFFSLLLKDEDIKKQVLGLYIEKIYNSLQK